jgi:hypothetical protein
MSDDTITVSPGVGITVKDDYGDNWFPVYVDAGRWESPLFLRRVELHALRLRLDEIDDSHPPVEGSS